MKKRKKSDPVVLEIERVLDLGQFISYNRSWDFVRELEDTEKRIDALVKNGEAKRAVGLYEMFLLFRRRTGLFCPKACSRNLRLWLNLSRVKRRRSWRDSWLNGCVAKNVKLRRKRRGAGNPKSHIEYLLYGITIQLYGLSIHHEYFSRNIII